MKEDEAIFDIIQKKQPLASLTYSQGIANCRINQPLNLQFNFDLSHQVNLTLIHLVYSSDTLKLKIIKCDMPKSKHQHKQLHLNKFISKLCWLQNVLWIWGRVLMIVIQSDSKKKCNYSLCQILKENAYISNKKFIERKENSFENRRTYIKNTVVTLMQ